MYNMYNMKQYVELDLKLRALHACMPDVQACMHAVRCALYMYYNVIIKQTRIATNIVTVPGLNFRAQRRKTNE